LRTTSCSANDSRDLEIFYCLPAKVSNELILRYDTNIY
jgi:hypothetical protein